MDKFTNGMLHKIWSGVRGASRKIPHYNKELINHTLEREERGGDSDITLRTMIRTIQ